VINKWTIPNCQLLDNGLLLWHVAAILQIFVTRNRLTFLPSNRQETKRRDKRGKKLTMLRWDFEPTPFRTRTLIWRLRPTRPSQRVAHGTYNIDKQEKQNLLRVLLPACWGLPNCFCDCEHDRWLKSIFRWVHEVLKRQWGDLPSMYNISIRLNMC
jgi:hypothetical protein